MFVPHSSWLVTKIRFFALGLLLVLALMGSVPVLHVAGQTQYIVASPGYVNFGMNVTVSVTAPAAGTYALTVVEPNGTQFKLNETFSSAGQLQNVTFGNLTSGFKSVINQPGTYNAFLEQGSTFVSSTSFYATNKLLVTMTVVNSGTCILVQGVDRGVKIFPRFFITYASSGVQVTNSDKGISVNFTLPGGGMGTAGWDPFAKQFVGGVLPNWNYTNIGPWNPNASIVDAAGNTATFNYTGSPFTISPATLSTAVAIVGSNTNQTLSGFANGTSATVFAVVNYPTNAEPVTGFVAPLDSVKRGGSVTALIGWGYYNATSGTFGGGNTVGGKIGQVALSYTGAGGIWEGNYTASSVPALTPGAAYEVVVSAKDDASPPNTGSGSVVLGPASGVAVSSTSLSSQTTTITTTSTSTSASIPLWAYAGTTIALIVGVIVGVLARRPKGVDK